MPTRKQKRLLSRGTTSSALSCVAATGLLIFQHHHTVGMDWWLPFQINRCFAMISNELDDFIGKFDVVGQQFVELVLVEAQCDCIALCRNDVGANGARCTQ